MSCGKLEWIRTEIAVVVNLIFVGCIYSSRDVFRKLASLCTLSTSVCCEVTSSIFISCFNLIGSTRGAVYLSNYIYLFTSEKLAFDLAPAFACYGMFSSIICLEFVTWQRYMYVFVGMTFIYFIRSLCFGLFCDEFSLY